MMVSAMLLVAGLLQTGPFDDCQALVQAGAAVEQVPAPWAADAISSGAVPPGIGDGQIRGLVCPRDSIVPLAGDEQVLIRLGMTLYIVADERLGVLDAPDGHISFRLLTGQLNEDEAPAMMAFLNSAQGPAQAAPVKNDR